MSGAPRECSPLVRQCEQFREGLERQQHEGEVAFRQRQLADVHFDRYRTEAFRRQLRAQPCQHGRGQIDTRQLRPGLRQWEGNASGAGHQLQHRAGGLPRLGHKERDVGGGGDVGIVEVGDPRLCSGRCHTVPPAPMDGQTKSRGIGLCFPANHEEERYLGGMALSLHPTRRAEGGGVCAWEPSMPTMVHILAGLLQRAKLHRNVAVVDAYPLCERVMRESAGGDRCAGELTTKARC